MDKAIITVVGKDTVVTQELGDLGKGVGVQVKCQREDIFDMMHRI